jgi:hypothetical protein
LMRLMMMMMTARIFCFPLRNNALIITVNNNDYDYENKVFLMLYNAVSSGFFFTRPKVSIYVSIRYLRYSRYIDTEKILRIQPYLPDALNTWWTESKESNVQARSIDTITHHTTKSMKSIVTVSPQPI